MAISALTPPPTANEFPETLLEFPDNRLLIDLCGEFDRNLAQIEHALSVQIMRRGNQLAIMGEDAARQRTSEVLQSLYMRLEAGREIGPGDIDGEIRMGPDETADERPSDDQMELFQGGRVEIKTREKGGRTADRCTEGLCARLVENETGVRDRAGWHRQDLSGRRRGRDRCSSGATSTGLSSAARRSKRASGSGFFRGT